MAFIFEVAVVNLVELMQEILVEHQKQKLPIIEFGEDKTLFIALGDSIPILYVVHVAFSG